MAQPKIGKEEFKLRLGKIQDQLSQRHLDGLMVYGDEYRKENLRYVSNFWPIFERGACFIPCQGDPVLAGAAEGEAYAREMCVWDNILNVKEFACVSVPEEIDFPNSDFTPLKDVILGTLKGGKRLGIVGTNDIPAPVMEMIKAVSNSINVEAADDIMNDMRLIKSPDEIACLKEAGHQACVGYAELLKKAVPGNSELMAAGAAEGAARMAGAEDINFTIFGSGKRADTVIGRPTNKIIEDGDMIMSALAVQYEGYVATAEIPFVAGHASDGQKVFLNVLFEAANEQLKYLHSGAISGEMVSAVRAVFRKHNLQEYDIYPPMHGIGLAEAESPYPDENALYPFESGMCVNSDISLFGHPHGSNRIEEGFVITDDGPESLTPLMRDLCSKGI